MTRLSRLPDEYVLRRGSARRVLAILTGLILLAGCGRTQSLKDGPNDSQSDTATAPIERSLSGTSTPLAPRRQDYVGSEVCAECHAEIARTYAEHAMGRSLGAVSDVPVLETDGDQSEFTPPGNRTYRVERTPEGIFHHEIGQDASGALLYDQRVPVHYAIGSGTRGRSYLTNRDGLLMMSPLGWYAGGERWDLSPGYHPQSHQRFDRQVSDGCLACHAGRMNSRPHEPNTYVAAQPFLEQSIGCERCHGPGETHVRHRRGETDVADLIVNPTTLDPLRQNAICNQCHLQGTRRMTRVGRSEFDFRPGDLLTDIWNVNVGHEKKGGEADFPAVTQSQQLLESACFRGSRALVCTTCHDPHRSIAPADRAAYFSERCQSCHRDNTPCAAEAEVRAGQSCIACHMPRLATSNVPHTSQTDHRIPRIAAAQPLARTADEIQWFEEGRHVIPADETQRATGIVLADLAQKRSNYLLARRALEVLKPVEKWFPNDVPLLQALGNASRQVENLEDAVHYWKRGLQHEPRNPQLLESLALYYHYQGHPAEAKACYEQLLDVNPGRAEFHGRYSHVLGTLGDWPAAIAAGERCLELNPMLTHVHLWLADAYDRTNQPTAAAQHRVQHARATPPE